MGWKSTIKLTREEGLRAVTSELEDQKAKIVAQEQDDVKRVLGKLGISKEENSPLGSYLSEEEFSSLVSGLSMISNRELALLLDRLREDSGFNYTVDGEG